MARKKKGNRGNRDQMTQWMICRTCPHKADMRKYAMSGQLWLPEDSKDIFCAVIQTYFDQKTLDSVKIFCDKAK